MAYQRFQAAPAACIACRFHFSLLYLLKCTPKNEMSTQSTRQHAGCCMHCIKYPAEAKSVLWLLARGMPLFGTFCSELAELTTNMHFPQRQESIGIALALCGNMLISVSLNLQKYAHNRESQSFPWKMSWLRGMTYAYMSLSMCHKLAGLC
jgi:hypothetical protein